MEKRGHESMYKTDTKTEAKRATTSAVGGVKVIWEASPLLLSQY